MTRTIASLIFSLLSITAFAQNEDQVITIKGDTLSGKVLISNSNNTVQTITLKNEKDKTHYKAYELKSVIKDGDVYHTLKIEGKYQLGLLVKKGYLSLYKHVSGEPNARSEFSESILIKKDGEQRPVPNLGFKKQLSNFLGDCESIQQALEAKKYSKSDLNQLIDDYNTCIKEKTALLNSGKPAINLNPEKTDLVSSLISDVNTNDNMEDQEGILEMLNDLDTKIKKGAPIPGYLKTALRSSLKNDSVLTEKLNKILE